MHGNWTQQRLAKGSDMIRLPPNIDVRQAAMLKSNPATAMFCTHPVGAVLSETL
jgi:NADPH:quinone reductase-like Zn-dependent oxidoreductase